MAKLPPMDALTQIDLMLRGGGIATFALCAIAVLRAAPGARLAWALAAAVAGLVAGSYLHGLFEGPAFRAGLLEQLGRPDIFSIACCTKT